ncbi:MAG: putative quinol monooxygenase [Candidatus Nanopelagicales bacterium]
MIVALSSARIRRDLRSGFEEAALAMVAGSRAEAGCVSYAFAADLGDPDVVLCVEVWLDDDALETHMAAEHTQRFLAAAPSLTDGDPQMQLYRVAAQD